MDFRQIEYVATIGRTGNITQAAKELYVSRSALNYSLLKLEEELGLSLFSRDYHAMVPTEAGQVFLRSAEKILAARERMNFRMEELADCSTGCIAFGSTPGSYGPKRFSKIYQQFHKIYPRYLVNLVEEESLYLQQKLRRGELDIIWASWDGVDDGLEYEIMTESEVVVAVSWEHPMAKKVMRSGLETDLREWKDEPFVLMPSNTVSRSIADSCFDAVKVKPKVLFECSLMEVMLSIARNNRCAFFTWEDRLKNTSEFCWFRLQSHPKMRVVLAYRKGSSFTKAEQTLMQLVRDYYPEKKRKEV